jgi:membrane-associated phospholipid phosphatase
MSTRATLALQSGIEALLRWDEAMLAAVAKVERRGAHAVMRGFTRAGDTPGWIAHGLLAFVLLGIDAASLGVMTAAGVTATIVSQAAKRAFRRARPSASIAGFTARSEDPDPFSFPSGHSTVAFAIATAALATAPVLGAFEVLMAAMIACSRVALGAHYPVDVLAGMALGVACGLAAWGVLC